MGKLVHGGRVYAEVVHGSMIVTPDLITDVSEFTKVYDTTSTVSYGSLGTKVSNALDITDADVLNGYMSDGWNESHACYYDAENKIGAYAGYDFGKEIHIETVKFWIGKYSAQNKSLYATVQWRDNLGNWNDFTDLDVSSNIGYPINIFTIYLNKKCYGVRWIHKNGEEKNSGNNIVFFGMCLYQYVELPIIRALIPKMTSNTAPSGVASASTEYTSDYSAYRALDNSINTLWGTANVSPAGQWIKYDFGESTQVCAFSFINRNSTNNAVGEFILQGSFDDTNWVDIKTVTGLSIDEVGFVSLDNSVSFRYYRWYIVSNVPGSYNNGTGFVELQLYGNA